MLIVWFIIFAASLALLVKSADWLIESAEKVGLAFKIPSSLIAITALAVGTSLPELMVSVKAAYKKRHEIALGNIFWLKYT